MPQRPDHQQEIVAEFSSRDEMNLFSLKQEERDRVEVSPTLDHNRMTLAQLAWYSKELEMSIARLENEKAAIQAQHEVVLNRIREMQNDNRGFWMAKIEYHRDRGNYLEIYDHESLNDINDALYEYCEKTSITDAPDAFVELPVYLRDIYAIRTPPVSVIHIGYVRLSIEEDEDRYIVRHYTLDRKELPNEWNMSNFYNGEYGLKSANNLRS